MGVDRNEKENNFLSANNTLTQSSMQNGLPIKNTREAQRNNTFINNNAVVKNKSREKKENNRYIVNPKKNSIANNDSVPKTF